MTKIYDQREAVFEGRGINRQRERDKFQPFRGKRQDGFKVNKPKAPAGWSHQQELTALIGKQVNIVLGDHAMSGTLLDADQFTLKLAYKKTPNEPAKPVVLFKSALTYFHEAN